MRITSHEAYMQTAEVFAKRSTCCRRMVGCVLVDIFGVVLSTGYNGVARGMKHCNEGHPCIGSDAQSGTRLDECLAIHAEQNALLQCKNIQKIHTCYVTTSPCIHCMKMLMNTNCQQIYARSVYDYSAIELWESMGRKFFKLEADI